jgi:hypothetical protein
LAELDQTIEDLKKENADFKEKDAMLRENLASNKKMLGEMTTKVFGVTKENEEIKKQLESESKANKDIKENCEKYENQLKLQFDQKAYFLQFAYQR